MRQLELLESFSGLFSGHFEDQIITWLRKQSTTYKIVKITIRGNPKTMEMCYQDMYSFNISGYIYWIILSISIDF